MARGFVTGVLWGGVAVASGLVVLSLLLPPPDSAPQVAVAPVVIAADKAAADKAAADKVAADKAAADKVAADKAAADKIAADKVAADKVAADKVAADKVAAGKAAADKLAADKAAADKSAADKAASDRAFADKAAADKLAAEKAATVKAADDIAAAPPSASADAPAALASTEPLPLPDVPAAPEVAPSLTGLDQALTVPAAETAPVALEPVPAPPEGPKDALLVPGQPPGQEPSRLPQIAAADDPDLAPLAPAVVPEPAPDAQPKESPASTLQDDQATLPPAKPLQDKLPTTVLDKTVPGVKVDQLPQIGAAPAVKADAVPPADLPPVQRFARVFDGGGGKPLFVILLHDVGAAGMSRDELAKLPFPVSFVIDPLATDAKAASAAYRAAGQEVLTLANGIPLGATAGDLETTFQTLSSILPQSVGVIDQDIGGFQDNRPLAGLVLPVIKGEGRGLVTYDRGLNAADQIAQREGVPSAVIFRRLDAEGESKQTIRRYLDRAAFKAAQEGSVVVIGDTRADTVAAILEWTVEGKAASVSLAPVTAVMGR